MSFGMADVFIEKQNKPTDKDIVKAWELCFAEKGTKQTCGKCPYHKFGELCKVKRGRDTLDLINRQQAEIERLQKLCDSRKFVLNGVLDKLIDDGIKQEEHLITMSNDMIKTIENAKVIAIKEFAERLCEGRVSNDPVVIAVKAELKEMVGK